MFTDKKIIFSEYNNLTSLLVFIWSIGYVFLFSSLLLLSPQMFSRAKQGLVGINSRSKNATDQEKKVAKNVMSSLALSLQDLSVNFRKSQSNYLKSE